MLKKSYSSALSLLPPGLPSSGEGIPFTLEWSPRKQRAVRTKKKVIF